MNIPSTDASPLRGIACMVAGFALLTLNDAVLKWLTASYPTGEIVFMRSIFVMMLVAILAWRLGGLKTLRVVNLRGQLVRAGLMTTATLLFVTSLRLMPLADAVAIAFAAPLFITALARPLLGERVGWRRWVAVLVGFSGVLIMFRPTGETMRLVALIPLSVALASAFKDIITRQITATESSVAILFITTLALAAAGLVTVVGGWRAITLFDLGLFAIGGFLLGSAQYLTIEAFRYAEAAVVAPFEYSAVLWAMLYGYLIWGDVPDRWIISGSVLVIGSGLYILYRESRRR
jgi:drug/metabolite transporter (DMT)-like permease